MREAGENASSLCLCGDGLGYHLLAGSYMSAFRKQSERLGRHDVIEESAPPLSCRPRKGSARTFARIGISEFSAELGRRE